MVVKRFHPLLRREMRRRRGNIECIGMITANAHEILHMINNYSSAAFGMKQKKRNINENDTRSVTLCTPQAATQNVGSARLSDV